MLRSTAKTTLRSVSDGNKEATYLLTYFMKGCCSDKFVWASKTREHCDSDATAFIQCRTENYKKNL